MDLWNRKEVFGHYSIRVREEHASLIPGGWPQKGIPGKTIDLGAIARTEAIERYNVIRAETYRQQVTLYGPTGSRVREALGTGAQTN